MSTQLIFVSGFGDSHQRYYRFLQRVWRKDLAQVYTFGWDDPATDFDTRFRRFIQYLDTFSDSDELVIVGISAGGTVGINALQERPDRIVKVVAVCSPLHPYDKYLDAGLKVAILRVQEIYRSFDDDTKTKITTIHGWHDGVVPVHLTPLPGAHNVRVFGFMHAMNIVMATIILRRKLRAIFRK